jgi:V-type H+-transporting ATPase subunit E
MRLLSFLNGLEFRLDPIMVENRAVTAAAWNPATRTLASFRLNISNDSVLTCRLSFLLFTQLQTEHDFNLEKQTLVHEAKLNIQDEFAKKEKDREIQERIARSTEIGECRVKKMQIRDELLNTLVSEAGAKCAVVTRGQNYPQLLQKLIVQGLIKIEENEVAVFCRGEDVKTVEKILVAAVQEYVDIIKRESSVTLVPKVTINPERSRDLPESSYGGVLLTACNAKIVCDNTMASRLNLVYSELLPAIRAILFPEVAA